MLLAVAALAGARAAWAGIAFDSTSRITLTHDADISNPADVPFVFLTHLHHDHICDFPIFAITGWMWGRVGRPIRRGLPEPLEMAGDPYALSRALEEIRGER